jgi:predicted RNase H-like HicB family nuclease
MEIPVLIEPVPGNGFRASIAELSAIVADGATAEEALAQFKEHVTAKVRNGARIASVRYGKVSTLG